MKYGWFVIVVACLAGNALAAEDTPAQKPAESVQKDSAVQETAGVESVQKDSTVQKTARVVQSSGCLAKARILAARGRVFHPGGGMGGYHYEGVGSGATASQALANCCYSGKRRVAAQAVVKGANGRYYAVRWFH
jgi:hypothetical protein